MVEAFSMFNQSFAFTIACFFCCYQLERENEKASAKQRDVKQRPVYKIRVADVRQLKFFYGTQTGTAKVATDGATVVAFICYIYCSITVEAQDQSAVPTIPYFHCICTSFAKQTKL